MAPQIIISQNSLRRIGLRGVQMIRERTLGGIDADGQPFAPYSQMPFAMPLGAMSKKARKALGDGVKIFRRDGRDTLWALVLGGYAAYKAAAYPQDGGSVNLSATGAMLRALTVIGVDARTGAVRIGFSRDEEARKAGYQMNGRHIRKFLGFTDQEKGELAGMAAESVQIRI